MFIVTSITLNPLNSSFFCCLQAINKNDKMGIMILFIVKWSFCLSERKIVYTKSRHKMSANVLGVWRSGFDLEAGTVNLAQN